MPGDYCRHVVIAKIPFAVPDSPLEAALAGAYVHGLAGQLAVEAVHSPRSLLAGDVAAALGLALDRLEQAP